MIDVEALAHCVGSGYQLYEKQATNGEWRMRVGVLAGFMSTWHKM